MGIAEPDEPRPPCSGFRDTTLRAVRQCLSAGREENYISCVGQFLRIWGHMLEHVGYTCEAMSIGEMHALGDTREEEDRHRLMQRTMQSPLAATSGEVGETPTTSSTCPSAPSRGLREEGLTAEDRAIMHACEQDETWQTIRQMRGSAKEKFLTCLCILVQEVVGDAPAMERFRYWARR